MWEYGIRALGSEACVIDQVRSDGHGGARQQRWWLVSVIGDTEGLVTLSQIVYDRALPEKFAGRFRYT